jgi:hypothetical protein
MMMMMMMMMMITITNNNDDEITTIPTFGAILGEVRVALRVPESLHRVHPRAHRGYDADMRMMMMMMMMMMLVMLLLLLLLMMMMMMMMMMTTTPEPTFGAILCQVRIALRVPKALHRIHPRVDGRLDVLLQEGEPRGQVPDLTPHLRARSAPTNPR